MGAKFIFVEKIARLITDSTWRRMFREFTGIAGTID